jgi:hypothetical protein
MFRIFLIIVIFNVCSLDYSNTWMNSWTNCELNNVGMPAYVKRMTTTCSDIFESRERSGVWV